MLRITIQVGTEVEGAEIKQPLREMLFPHMSDAELAAGLRDWIKERMALQVQGLISSGAATEANRIVDENTIPIS